MYWYKRHIGDFTRDTSHLSATAVGCYDLMLDWYYTNERPLPPDKADVYRIVRAGSRAERLAADKVLAEFFTLDGDGFRNRRADKELVEYAARCEIKKANGSKGGRPKKVTKTEPNGNLLGSSEETYSKPNGNLPSRDNLTTKQQQQKQTSSSLQDSRSAPERSDDDERDLAGFEGIPETINRETFAQFVRHRRVLRKPLSAPGWMQIRQRLLELARQGHDLNESLRQTMAAGLAIPVEPKPPSTAGPPSASTSKTRNAVETLMQGKTNANRTVAGTDHPNWLGEAGDAAPRRLTTG